MEPKTLVVTSTANVGNQSTRSAPCAVGPAGYAMGKLSAGSFLALIMMAAFVAMTALGYASAVDPSWIDGIYDGADYDEVVNLLTETSGVGGATAWALAHCAIV